jgi:hypothetical protein
MKTPLSFRRAPSSLPILAFLATIILLLSVATRASAQMSETEKKAAARAAYQEGVKLQDDGKAAEALTRFESAQKLFDAPTHLLHVAECQALTGRLVEASETYELLARKTLPAGAPDAFVQAQTQGQAELPALRARIPTLRVTVKPGPQQVQNLQVNVNGVIMPNELLGIARPLNPGTYRFSAAAVGWSTAAPIDVPLGEKEQKSVELTLQQGQAGAPPVVIAPAPAPAPYVKNPDRETKPSSGPTSSGMLFGIRAGAFVPAGEIGKNANFSDYATTGGGGGVDVDLRLARMLLIGATFEFASLGAPKSIPNVVGNFDATATTSYFGINLGIVPNIDHVSFIGDLGLGSRTAKQSLKGSTGTQDTSLTGLDFTFGAGVSIPAGPIRIVPKISVSVGSFSSADVTASGAGSTTVSRSGSIDSNSRGTHTVVFLGLAGYYSLDFGSKPGSAAD